MLVDALASMTLHEESSNPSLAKALHLGAGPRKAPGSKALSPAPPPQVFVIREFNLWPCASCLQEGDGADIHGATCSDEEDTTVTQLPAPKRSR
jgi:hypothetical protein